jgi:hypothetical protein
MSRQVPPSKYTFGWNIFEKKRAVGALFGYSSVSSVGEKGSIIKILILGKV